jgi:hypothetical protein
MKIFMDWQSSKPAFRLLCPKQIFVSKNKLNYTMGWSKGGKKAHRKSCFKPTTQRAS